jgi:hypothetical protein
MIYLTSTPADMHSCMCVDPLLILLEDILVHAGNVLGSWLLRLFSLGGLKAFVKMR